MRITLVGLAAAGLLSATGSVHADQELVVRKNCSACHFVDKRKYGPSFQQIAEKYANDKKAVDKLAAKIRKGGTGVWGQDVMPPQPQVSAAEAKVIATYVLSLK